MSQNIQVGSTVKVVTGGRYLGKTGKVEAVMGTIAAVAGSFPRSANKKEQLFDVTNLEVISTPPQTAKAELAEVKQEIEAESKAIPPGLRNIEKKLNLGQNAEGEQSTFPPLETLLSPRAEHPSKYMPPLPTKENDAETAKASSFSAAIKGTTVTGALANRLASKFAPSADTAPHLIVKARAGTGKTTTLVHGVRRVLGLPSDLIPSPQQQAVWDAMEESKGKLKGGIGFCAFNKAIATELQARLPHGCEAATLHSLGFKAVKASFGRVVSVNQYRTSNLIAEVTGRDVFDLRKEQPAFLRLTERLVGLCKMSLIGEFDTHMTWAEELSGLISYHDLDTDGVGNMSRIYETVPLVLDRAKDVLKDNAVDFDDMIWLPVVLGLAVAKYGMLLVDEFQDLNRCQQALAKMHGERIIGCGDDRQAIYGFAGADCQSMDRMAKELGATERGCQVLPLTVTRRCGKAIVREANKIVSDFDAFESNPEGVVSSAAYPSKTVTVEQSFMNRTADGDMVLCRCNAPLVSTCFKFLRIGRKAQIQGRDIGQGLISTIKKLKAVSVADLQKRLDIWLLNEQEKENNKRNPSEDKLIAMQDRYDCLCMFMEGVGSVPEVISKIESVFTDNKTNPGVKLSSIHKSKGLEADRVFLLQLKRASVPHPMAKSAWAREQEMNLKYVAVTRAIHELVIVTGGDEDRRVLDDGE